MANIYQIQQDLLAIFDTIEEMDGEITPEIEEQLTITQESFKEKIGSYAAVVKQLDTDIASIKAEKVRLSDLQKSKEKTIERLKSIMAEAITMFGDTSKTGSKFVDYGTGKCSIRTSESIEVDETITDRFVNRFISCLNWYKMQNQLDKSLIDYKDILDYCNAASPDEEGDCITPVQLNDDDLDTLSANIDLRINLKELLSTDRGFNLAKALIDYNVFNIVAKADKTAIKNEAKENHTMPTYATLVRKSNITIK